MANAILYDIIVVFKIIFYVIYRYLEAFFRIFKAPNKKSIAGETVLITGAGHGIGRQLALQLSKLGTTVVIWDLNKETNEKTAEEINQTGGKAFAYVCDVTDSSQIAKVAAKVREDVGEISILVNNAGILNGAYLQDLEEKRIRLLFEVNTLSHFWMIKEFLPHMMKENHGHILNVASIAGYFGAATLTDYCSSKSAVIGFGNALGPELVQQGYDGIIVTSLCPMIADTGMLRNFHCKIAPLLTPEQVAEAAVDGLLRNYAIITVPTNFWVNVVATAILPRKAQDVMQRFGLISVYPQVKKED